MTRVHALAVTALLIAVPAFAQKEENERLDQAATVRRPAASSSATADAAGAGEPLKVSTVHHASVNPVARPWSVRTTEQGP